MRLNNFYIILPLTLVFIAFLTGAITFLTASGYHLLTSEEESRGVAIIALILFGPMTAAWLYYAIKGYLFPVQMMLRVTGARLIYSPKKGALPNLSHEENWLIETVQKLCAKTNLYCLPHIGVAPDDSINGYAVGPTADKSLIVVHSGAFAQLRPDVLEALVAHEVGHILNQDNLITYLMTMNFDAFARMFDRVVVPLRMTFLQMRFLVPLIILGVLLHQSSTHNPELLKIIYLSGGGLAFLYVLPWLIRNLYRILFFAVMRSREYRADIESARLTSFDQALHLLEFLKNAYGDFAQSNISVGRLFDTHPSITSRIRALQKCKQFR